MKERFGLYPKDGESEGIYHDNPEDCIFWFSNGAYFDPVTPECIFITGDAYNLWDRTEIWGQVKLAKPIWDISPGLVTTIGERTATLGGGSTLGSANVYTYRTPDFMLSSAQNYHRKFDGLFLRNLYFRIEYFSEYSHNKHFQLVGLLVNSNHGKQL